MADVNPFALIQQGVENTNALFGGMQRSILQTRQLQLQEQAQIFSQGIQLKTLDLKEKEMNLDARVTMAKLGMAEQQMGWDAAHAAARIDTEKAHANYYNAQAFKAQQLNIAAPYVEPNLNGNVDDFLSSGDELQTVADQSIDPALQGVLDEMEQPPVADAYREPSLPTNLGTSLYPGGAETATTQAMVDQGYSLFEANPKAQTTKQRVASTWDQINRRTEQFIQGAAGMKGTDMARRTRIEAIERNRLELAAKLPDDPGAQAFLNARSESEGYIRERAQAGDETSVRDAQRIFRDQYGYDNPNYQRAAREGFSQYEKAKQSEALNKRYEELLRAYKLAEEAKRSTTAIEAQLDQIEKTLQLSTVPGAARTRVESAIDQADAGDPYYSPSSNYP